MSTEEPIVESIEDSTAPVAVVSSPPSQITSTSAPTGASAAVTVAATTTGVTSAVTASATIRLTGETLEQHCRNVEDELQILRESEIRLKQQYTESQRRERILIRRLALKEQELQDYANQIAELKTAQAPGTATLRAALLDPAVNILFQKLKSELQSTRARLEETQNELSAWKFTPDSNTGKRLMAKCRLLYQENEELGKMTSNGRLAKLEGDLALQKSFSEEVKKSQSELDDFLQELDEDVEGMQSTILFLQQALKTSKDTITGLEREVIQLKNSGNGRTNHHQQQQSHIHSVDENTGDGVKDDEDDDDDDDDDEEENDENEDNRHKRMKNGGGSAILPVTQSADADGSLSLATSNAFGGGTASLINGGVITNCSVILRCDKDVLKLNNSERILRKDKNNTNHKKVNQPRTLRSSSRQVTAEDLRTTKVNRNMKTNAICNGNASTEDVDVHDDDDDMEVGQEGLNGGGGVSNNDLGDRKFNNNKRTYGEVSDTSDEDDDDEDDEDNGGGGSDNPTATTTTNRTVVSSSSTIISGSGHKLLIKKARRSSVLSLDLNEEDSQIDIDDERTIVVNSNGTKIGGRTVD